MTTVPRLRGALKGKAPSTDVERELWGSGVDVVVGVDEVGRGAWAGPLTVGAAVIPVDRRVYKVRDSKMLSEGERESMFDRIAGWCRAWSIGHAMPSECDALGMADAQRLAARRALDGLGLIPEVALVDGPWDFIGDIPTRTLVKGDAHCLSIAAASILAKVTRDRQMREDAEPYPHWAFDSNKGYPDPRHRAALQWFGPSAIHRRSWVFMESLPWNGVERVERDDGQGTLF
jgi:ribonuclease HII